MSDDSTNKTACGDSAEGRQVTQPGDMPRAGWKDVLWRVWTRVNDDHVSVMAGGIAFFSLLAIIPGLGAFISISALIFEPGSATDELQRLEGVLPASSVEILQSQAQGLDAQGDGGLGVAALGSLIVALVLASRGVNNLIEGINLANNEIETRNLLVRNAVAVGLTLLLLLMSLTALGTIVVVPTIASILRADAMVEFVVNGISFTVLALLSMASLALIYRFAPARRPAKWSWVSAGSVIATVLWLVSSAIFSLYVANFGSYNETYGALGGAVILLLWLWLSCFVVLLGAHLNAELEHQTCHDTTRGPDRPMGERGAYMADTLGQSVR
ncbi:YihY/virulence factor BrkB family protein [Roseisalinus antarcticus]|uniref:Uncharacterized protein n=1 Tax=Roseisalinus antarcticus TaxID=254357 RepID=A0A1Y5TYC0_9RHOB|nr:YihY/virulence factor BrkB family protein [Roseisalinus antarcticus]SLN76877.1 hypothetical protein ROA7023_04262 [Roseisalinus antarcticus]